MFASPSTSLPSSASACTGEINTLQGNLNWVASREHELTHPVWKGREGELTPLCDASASDSANLDRVAELLVRTGFEAPEALMLLVPEAYRNHPDLMKTYPEVRCGTSWGGAEWFRRPSVKTLTSCRVYP